MSLLHPKILGGKNIEPTLVLVLAPLLGLAVSLLIVANASFLGMATIKVSWLAGFVGLATLVFVMAQVKNQAVILAGLSVLFVVLMHFLWPSIEKPANLLLVDAGDFNQYIGLGSHLVTNPISLPPHTDEMWNPLQHNLADHQKNFLRLGAIFTLSFVSALTGKEVAQIYSGTIGFFVALQALSFLALLRCALPKINLYYSTLVACLFGVAPITTWPAYASFVPQTLGMAYLLALFAIFIEFIKRDSYRDDFASQFPLLMIWAVLFFAQWSIYPEPIPVLVSLYGLFLLAMCFQHHLCSKFFWSKLFRAAFVVLLIWFVLSPEVFLWGLRGFIVQFGVIAHGGEQIATPLNLFSTMVMASQLPLLPDLLNAIPPDKQITGIAMGLLAVIGILVALLRAEDRPFAVAVLLTSMLLFAAVAYKYRFEAYGKYPLWMSLYTWNLFKAAQYAAAFTSVLALGGLLRLIQYLPTMVGLLSIILISAISLNNSRGQDMQVYPRMYNEKIEAMDLELFRSIPQNGRLLVYLPDLPYYTRYAVYSLLRDRPFMTVRDWQPDILYKGNSASSDDKSFFDVPVRYILTTKVSKDNQTIISKENPVIREGFNYVVREVKSPAIQFEILGNGRPPLGVRSGPNGLKTNVQTD